MATGLKPTFKRPFLHHIIIVCYIAAPFANVVLLKIFLHVSAIVVLKNLIAGYGLLATIWLCTAPIAGILLYFARRFSWYIFLGHSSLILLDFIFKWVAQTAYYLTTVPGTHTVLLLAGNIALVVVVNYIIQRDFRAPYFQVLSRSWREGTRIPIHHTVMVDGQQRIMNDLSVGGCFVLETERKQRDKVKLSFQSNSLSVDCAGEIMRVTPAGIGIRFLHLPQAGKRDIRTLLKNRFELRQKVDMACTWVFQEHKSQSRMVDLSSRGCYLQAQLTGLREGVGGELRVALPRNRHSYRLPGEVVWINRMGEHDRPVGFGFRFSRRQAGFMKDMTLHYGKGTLVR